MMKYVMIVLIAMMATSGHSTVMAVECSPAVLVAARRAGAEDLGVRLRKAPLDKTWTIGGQEDEAGSQVLAVTSLTSPGSFPAEGKGFEPSTGCPAPDFESGC
jgi:hypothetical protein